MTRIPVFVLGAYMGKLCLHHQKIPVLVPILAIPVAIGLVVLINDIPSLSQSYIRFYEFSVLVPCIALSHAFVSSKFRKRGFLSKVIILIGSYSMEIYLLFESIYNNGIHLFTSPDETGMIYILTAFTATLVLAVLLKMVAEQLTRGFDAQKSLSTHEKEGAVS